MELAYRQDRQPQESLPEQALWLAVISQALSDLRHRDPDIQQDALEFFESADFLRVLALTGLDRDHAARIRVRDRVAEQTVSGGTVPGLRRGMIEFNGESRTLSAWAKLLGVRLCTLMRRLDRGWPVDRALRGKCRADPRGIPHTKPRSGI